MHQRKSEDVIRALASVDYCWFQRITRRKFKRRIWQRLTGFYGRTKKILAIIRNSRNYFLENVRPSDELMASLLSCNCLTEAQSHFISRKRSTRDKNLELFYVVRSFDETKFSNFVNCIRQPRQNAVARILENGGGVFKVEVQNSGIDIQRFHQRIEDLQNKRKQRSHQTERIVDQLKDKGIEILNSQLDRRTVVVWIWCQSEAALEHFQKLFKSNHLAAAFTHIVNIQPLKCPSENEINVDLHQFKTTIVMFTISIDFTKRLDMEEDEAVWAMTKLRDEICVLCLSKSFSSHALFFFKDRNPFCLQRKIEIKELKNPWDIASSEKDTCLYVSDYQEKCIWKITKETNDKHQQVTQWLQTGFPPQRISVSTGGQMVLANSSESSLMIYGSDAELHHFIRLPRDIQKPRHALETSIGNLIVLHEWDKDAGSEKQRRDWIWVVSELSRGGQQVIRRYIPRCDKQRLSDPLYLSLDSDDQVFVVDKGNDRVIQLDSNLKWIEILCPREQDDMTIRQPRKFCCDKDNKQLIIVGDFYLGDGVNIYTLRRT